ncbi:hypothetical protein CCP3SC1_2200002 [Gammaproteobacteria bacterium]
MLRDCNNIVAKFSMLRDIENTIFPGVLPPARVEVNMDFINKEHRSCWRTL